MTSRRRQMIRGERQDTYSQTPESHQLSCKARISWGSSCRKVAPTCVQVVESISQESCQLQSLPVFPRLHGLYISNMALYRPIVPYLQMLRCCVQVVNIRASARPILPLVCKNVHPSPSQHCLILEYVCFQSSYPLVNVNQNTMENHPAIGKSTIF